MNAVYICLKALRKQLRLFEVQNTGTKKLNFLFSSYIRGTFSGHTAYTPILLSEYGYTIHLSIKLLIVANVLLIKYVNSYDNCHQI